MLHDHFEFELHTHCTSIIVIRIKDIWNNIKAFGLIYVEIYKTAGQILEIYLILYFRNHKNIRSCYSSGVH